jgi:nicotinamidase-related amidase
MRAAQQTFQLCSVKKEGEHCLEGGPGTDLVEGFSPAGPREYLIVQRRYCAFYGTDLEILLRGLGATRLILFGNLTDVNVHYTFLGAHMRDFHLKVLSDAGIGSNETRHEAAFEAMAYLQRDAVCTSAELISELSR